MEAYTVCDQCARRCPVEALRCRRGRKRYEEVTGKPYVPAEHVEEDDGAAYRKRIRERRTRKRPRSE